MADERTPGREVVAAPRMRDSSVDPLRPCHVLHQGYTVLITQPNGELDAAERQGLLDFDTRILSRHRLTVGGQVPEATSASVLAANRWESWLRIPLRGGSAAGPRLPQDQLVIILGRQVGRGMHEHIEVRNYSMAPLDTELALELDADFADVQELGGPREVEGAVTRSWDERALTLLFAFTATRADKRIRRAMRAVVSGIADAGVRARGGTLYFSLALPARGGWHVDIECHSEVDGSWRVPLPEENPRADERRTWDLRRAQVESPSAVVNRAFERAAQDLFDLRNWELDAGRDAWVLNAGVPTYTGLFGRDALTAAWQAALLGPEMMRGALARIGERQAAVDDAWRDAEPGKLVHEVRRGPLSDLDVIPQSAYYGTQTTAAMYVLVLSELWHWTGDTGALARHRDVALSAMEWARRYGDRDADGFLEYAKRSRRGLKNQGWKDSDEAIRYPDGTLVDDPIATVEEQAFYFLALQRMAEMLIALGEDARAASFLADARELRRKWQAAFWIEDDGFYAMALDADKRPVRSIGSNAGHALGAGLVPPHHARIVADRLMSPELFSGWGIRTLSRDHPSYNPLGYHLGTVWPVENATFLLGFKRYGLDHHGDRLVTALFDAAGYFAAARLPEAIGGDGPDRTAVPIPYPAANSPQAWSASAVIQMVQLMVGLYPFAPARLLALVRPRLPSWLPWLTLRHVRVGDATVSLRFARRADGTATHEVLDRTGRLRILTVPPPNDVGDRGGAWLDGIKTWLLRHAPGRTARAIRLALGQLDARTT
jgi:glycogen debranching enzyme